MPKTNQQLLQELLAKTVEQDEARSKREEERLQMELEREEARIKREEENQNRLDSFMALLVERLTTPSPLQPSPTPPPLPLGLDATTAAADAATATPAAGTGSDAHVANENSVSSTTDTVVRSVPAVASMDVTPASSCFTKGLPPPSPLDTDASLRTYENWLASWENYAISMDLTLLPQQKQIAHLRHCLSDDMRSLLKDSLGVPLDAAMPVTEVLQHIDRKMRGQRNLTVRRQLFNQCRQQASQSFDSFFAHLRQLARDAELCATCHDSRLTDAIITGLSDRALAERLQAMDPPPSLEQVKIKCRSHESARKNNSELQQNSSQNANINKMSAYKQNKRNANKPEASRPRSPSRSRIPDEIKKKFSCLRCGDQKRHSNGKCPAKGKVCKTCNKPDHFNTVCFQTILKPASKTEKCSTKRIVINNIASTTACPTIDVHMQCSKKDASPKRLTADFPITPDSGSEATAIGFSDFCDLGLNASHLSGPSNRDIRAANGGPLQSVGVFSATLSYSGKSITGDVEVLLNFPSPVLSWYHARDLGILPPHYPRPHTPDLSCCKTDAAPRASCLKTTVTRAPEPPADTPESASIPASCTKRKPTPSMSPAEAKAFFLKEFSDVFKSSKDFQDGQLFKPMRSKPMKIHLKPDAKPFAIHAPRAIPIAWRDKVKAELDRLTSQGIITPVTDEVTPWVHALVTVPKRDGSVRVTVDLGKLNKQVTRMPHPFPTPHDVVRRIPPGCKYFSSMDAMMGYFQVPLDEDSQNLTCFMTPFGMYKFLRSPMGFVSSGDVFCRLGDQAIAGIENTGKIVDDILSWDEDYSMHIDRIYDILCRCSDRNITLNAEKFVFAVPETDYCGYQVSEEGIRVDPKKVQAIAEFPTPKNLTDLRSFFGLANQLSDFSYETVNPAEVLRPLLSPKNEFVWTNAHTLAFEEMRRMLTSTPTLAHFDPKLPTALQSDASRLNGIGYALLQKHGENWRLVQCGSRFLTPTEGRYSTGEVELLAAVYGIRKCRVYLQAMPTFELVMDHKPLIPTLNDHTLDQIDNPRLQRLKEKIAGYQYHAIWRKGKEHNIPDALSRAPVSEPDEDDFELEEDIASYIRCVVTTTTEQISESDDPIMDEIRSTALNDTQYQQLITRVTNGFPTSKSALPHDLLDYWSIRDDITHDHGLVLYRGRIVIPANFRREVLKRLHSSHRGREATKRRASQTVWWPGINNDIATTVEACHACQQLQPSQQREPLMRDANPTRPFENVSADLFSHDGKTYLVYADCHTGWCEVHEYTGDATSRTTIRAIRKWFAQLGVPCRMRTDGGPQFSSALFRSFMDRWRVQHDTSTPHYPQANGHAESNVKLMKHLIMKTSPKGDIYSDDAFTEGLLEIRNTPRPDGLSPARLLLGRPLRSLVPTHANAFDVKWHKINEDIEKRHATRQHADDRYNKHSKTLSPLRLGDDVRIQNHDTKRWDSVGVIVGIGKRRDYLIKSPSGGVKWRNRRFLRPVPPPESSAAPEPLAEDSVAPPAGGDDTGHVEFSLPAPASRRSTRSTRNQNPKYKT